MTFDISKPRMSLVIVLFVFISGCSANSTPSKKPEPQTQETMVNFDGTLAFTNLPPHHGLVVSLAFFGVDGPESAAPYEGDPPADAVTDCPELFNEVDLNVELNEASKDIPFGIQHSAGHFYIQVRVLLFRKHEGKVLAQSEQFFFGKRPLPLTTDLPAVTLPVEWPSIQLEDLEHYQTIKPQ